MTIAGLKAHRKILLLDIGAPYGGVEAYIDNLVNLLEGRAEFFCVCALPELATLLRGRGVHVICIPILATRWSKILRFLVASIVVPYLILRYRIDVVQMNGYLESALLLPVRMLGCFAIRTAHGPSEIERYRWYKRPEMYFPRLLSLLSLRFASRIVCVSEAVREDVKRIVPEERISVVANWVPLIPKADEVRTDLHNPIRILYLGRLEEYKGAQLLFEAVRGLAGIHIAVVGKGSFQAQLELLSKDLDVSFEGFHSDTRKYFESADIFVNPSMGPEGLPIVSLESMAYGLPCIFSDLPVHSEITNNGEGALLFRSGEARSLREKICAFMDEPEQRQFCSRSARAIVLQRYSPQAALAGYLRAFELE
jgi:glycosyltransferase involved in cell wall biosynthesis